MYARARALHRPPGGATSTVGSALRIQAERGGVALPRTAAPPECCVFHNTSACVVFHNTSAPQDVPRSGRAEWQSARQAGGQAGKICPAEDAPGRRDSDISDEERRGLF